MNVSDAEIGLPSGTVWKSTSTGAEAFQLNIIVPPVFVFKMCLLAATLVFTATVRRRVALADEGGLPSWVPKAVAAVSLALWMGVTISGRMITFYG